ncbi:hypothetical protein BH24GEM1_BH24GEM1_31680 [soil metagenome]
MRLAAIDSATVTATGRPSGIAETASATARKNLTFPNVLITAHQGFFTEEALRGIAETTLGNISAFETGRGDLHRIGGT